MEQWDTEKEAEEFLAKNGIKTNVDIMANFKANGHIKQCIIEKVEEEYNEYKFRKISPVPTASDLRNYIEQDKKLIDDLFCAIQYLKKQSIGLKEKLAEKEA